MLWLQLVGNACRRALRPRFPHEARFAAAFALQAAGDYEAALAGYEALREAAPKDLRIACNMAACARVVGRLDDAARLVDQAMRDHPRERAVLAEAAQVQEQLGRWSESLAYWERIVHTPTAHIDWRHHYVLNLITLGRFDTAEPLLRRWMKRDPDFRGFLALEAILASSRNRVDEALALWSAYRRRFPDDRTGWEHYGRAYQASEMARLDRIDPEVAVQAVPQAIARVDDEATQALLMNFESLGWNCEFGLVQRRYGAEPLGLLRFNTVGFGDLLAAVANGFAEMGDPERTEMTLSGNGEYYVRDRRWGLGMHTFIFQGQEDPDRIYKKFCRRVAYLRDRFLEDRAEGRKILVFTSPGLAADDLRLLHKALRSLGPAPLLHVVFAGGAGEGIAPGPPGTASRLEDGLFVGYVSRPGSRPAMDWDIAYDEWVSVCRQVQGAVAAG